MQLTSDEHLQEARLQLYQAMHVDQCTGSLAMGGPGRLLGGCRNGDFDNFRELSHENQAKLKYISPNVLNVT